MLKKYFLTQPRLTINNILFADKIFWLGKWGMYLNRTFPVFFLFDSKNKTLETNFRSNLNLTEKSQFNKYRFMATGMAESH